MEKTDWPDSDETARSYHKEDEAETTIDADTTATQTSNKTGKHSSVQKLAASRPEFSAGRGAQPVDGAFGNDEENISKGRGA